jgi:hypothetical protein
MPMPMPMPIPTISSYTDQCIAIARPQNPMLVPQP